MSISNYHVGKQKKLHCLVLELQVTGAQRWLKYYHSKKKIFTIYNQKQIYLQNLNDNVMEINISNLTSIVVINV